MRVLTHKEAMAARITNPVTGEVYGIKPVRGPRGEDGFAPVIGYVPSTRSSEEIGLEINRLMGLFSKSQE